MESKDNAHFCELFEDPLHTFFIVQEMAVQSDLQALSIRKHTSEGNENKNEAYAIKKSNTPKPGGRSPALAFTCTEERFGR